MSIPRRYFSIIFSLLLIINATAALACEMCTLPRLGKQKDASNESWFAEYYFELQNWQEINPREAHTLHHQGHHVHDKTKEYIHHYSLGRKFDNGLTLIADLPYVIRKSLEIHSHATLGDELRSEGLGDLHMMGLYQLWASPKNHAISGIAGVKFPTGETKETNPQGERFEAELQPGSGSFDYIFGGLYKGRGQACELTANLIYVFKTEGDQHYEFGDSLITSALWQYVVPVNDNTVLKLGVDGNLQYEQKHEDHGATVEDSGGVTLLLGPALSVEFNDRASLFASLHLPAHQNLGGVHQEVESIWNAGLKLHW